jgi:hypothetical protein
MTKINCVTITSVSKVNVEENKRRVIINNSNKEKYTVTEVDGCLIKNSIACDWLISNEAVGDVLIELKGCDVAHAVEQILATAEYIDKNKISVGKKAGLIICSKYPRIDTKVQKHKIAFAKKYNAPLHIVNNSGEFTFTNLFKFSGVLKSS